LDALIAAAYRGLVRLAYGMQPGGYHGEAMKLSWRGAIEFLHS